MRSKWRWALSSWLLAGAAVAAVGSWSTTGPHGGAVNKVEFHRSNPAIAYAAGDGGFYRSSDGGQSWRAAEVGLPPGLFSPRFWQAPSNGDVLYLLSFLPRNGLYRSADAGLTWRKMPEVGSNPRDAVDLAISPDNSGLLAIAFPDQIRKSGDGGQSFTTAGFPPAPFEARSLAVYGNRFLVGGENLLIEGLLFDSFEFAGGFDNSGWSHQALSGPVDWVLSEAHSQSPTHAWHAASHTDVSQRQLVSPPIGVVVGSTLRFFHTFAFETDGSLSACYDAGVIEVSTDGGTSWNPVPDAAFLTGGYNDTVETSFGNPLAGQRAWCQGTIGGMTEVKVALAAWAGQTVRVRWRAGDDNSNAATGWFVDSVFFTNSGPLLYRSEDAGGNWIATAVDQPDDLVVRLQFAPSSNNVAYYGAFSARAGRSVDGGQTWTDTDAQLDLRAPFWIAPSQPLQLIGASSGGLIGSNDGGLSAGPLGSTVTPTLSAVSAVSNYPGNPILLAGTTGRGILRTSNNAVNWVDSFIGYSSVLVRALAIPPQNPNRILAGQGDSGFTAHALQVSSDGGNSWNISTLNALANSIRGLAIDSTTSGPTVYATGRLFGTGLVQNGGIYKSLDGGNNWTVSTTGIPALGAGRSMGVVRAVVVDPRSCVAPPPSGPCTSGPLRTLYVAGSGRPNQAAGGWIAALVYKSVDGGATWARADTGLPSPGVGFLNTVNAISLVIDPINTGTLYVGLAGIYGDPGTPNGAVAGIYKTTNGGLSWTAVNNGLPGRPGASSLPPDVPALAIDPINPQVLYAGVSVSDNPGAPVAGVYRSSDGGGSWSNASNGLVGADVRALLVDRTTPSTVYAGSIGTYTNPGGVYKSLNSGGVWRSISGTLPSNSVVALARDPVDANTLYAGTNVGVWELTQVPDNDDDGAATSIENGAPNGGDGNADGIPDATQRDVASIVNGPIARGRINYTNMGGGSNAIDGAPRRGSSCTQLTDAYAIDPRIFPPDVPTTGPAFNHDEFGLVNVEVPDCPSLELTIKYFDGNFSSPDWTWRNYGPSVPGDDATVGWYAYPNAVKLNATTWRITVNAGQLGSWRASGSDILFRGGPALSGEIVFRDGFE